MRLNPVLINNDLHVAPTLEQKLELFVLARKFLIDFWNVTEANTKCICDCLYKAQRELDYMKEVDGFDRVMWSRSGRSEGYGHGNNIETNFPELLKYKPKNKDIGDHWWSMKSETKCEYGHKRRIRVCTMVIMDLQGKIRLGNG